MKNVWAASRSLTTNATCSRLLPRYDSGELASIGLSPRRRLPRGIGYISSATIYRERLEHGHGMARYPARYALVGRGADIANPSSASPYPRLSSIARLIGWVSATRA